MGLQWMTSEIHRVMFLFGKAAVLRNGFLKRADEEYNEVL